MPAPKKNPIDIAKLSPTERDQLRRQLDGERVDVSREARAVDRMRALHQMLDPRDHLRSCPTLAGLAPRVEAFAQVRPREGNTPERPVTVVRCMECAGQVVVEQAYSALMNQLAGQLVAAAADTGTR